MEKTVVFSVRLPESIVEKLGEVSKNFPYWKRNAIVEKALEAFCFAADLNNQKAILQWWRQGNPDATLKFYDKAQRHF